LSDLETLLASLVIQLLEESKRLGDSPGRQRHKRPVLQGHADERAVLHVEEAMANVTKGLHLQLTVTTDCVLRVTTARVLRETRSKVVQVDITNKF
jgi:hypothetical protein